MEMCYDGMFVMPSNYAVMSEDEMSYLEGGAVIATSSMTSAQCLTAYNKATKYSTINSFLNAIAGIALGVVINNVFGIIISASLALAQVFSKYSVMTNAFLKGSQYCGIKVTYYSSGDISYAIRYVDVVSQG